MNTQEERETPHIETDIGIYTAIWLKIFLDVFAGGGMAKVQNDPIILNKG